MAEETLGAKFSIDITDLKAGISQANRLIKESRSEFKAAAAGMDDWTKSEEGLTKKIKSLTDVQSIQQEKVNALKAEYKRLIDDGLDLTSAEAVKLRTKINEEEAALNKTTKEIDDNKTALSDLKASADKAEDGFDDVSEGADKASDELDDTSKSADKTGEHLEKLKNVASAVGKAIAAGLAAAGAAFGKLAKDAMENYGEYEQLSGGIEKLFNQTEMSMDEFVKNSKKSSAAATEEWLGLTKGARMVKNAAYEAFSTTGMTANEYMSTVSSFSASLIASLNGDTKKAAEASKVAISDMADNASMFGTSMESIQNAYAGFSKGQFNMLDNLKLGYGGTKTEMERLLKDAEKLSGQKYNIDSLSDLYSAIHVVQEEMGITGNAANEASKTIEGSINATKAAWQNVLTFLMSDDVELWENDMVGSLLGSIDNVIKNLEPKFKMLFANVSDVIAEYLPEAVRTVGEVLEDVLPIVTQGATTILDAFVSIMPSLTDAIIANLPLLLDGISQVTESIVSQLPIVIESIASALPSILPQLIDGVVQLIVMLASNAEKIINPVVEALPSMIQNVVTAILQNLPTLIQAAIDLTLGIVRSADKIIQTLVPMIPTITIQVAAAIVKEIPTIIAGVMQIVAELVTFVKDWYKSWIATFPAAFHEITSHFTSWWSDLKSNVSDSIETMKNLAVEKFEAIKNSIKEKMEAVKNGITEPVQKAKDFVDGIVEKLKAAFNFEWSLPHFKLPHLSVKGGEAPYGIGGKGSLPSFDVQWLKDGGIVRSATAAVVGEDGPEAVIPLKNNTEFLDYLAEKLNEKTSSSVVVNQTNNYSQAHSRYEIYKSKQQTAAAVRLALQGG